MSLRKSRAPLSSGSGHLFCLIRHPLIIAPIAAQWQALLAERLRFSREIRANNTRSQTQQFRPLVTLIEISYSDLLVREHTQWQ